MNNKLTEYKSTNHPKFNKEFNKIIKKHECNSLKKDFERLINALIENLESNNNNHFSKYLCIPISGVDNHESCKAYIVKNFRCDAIKKGKKSGFRITFIYDFENKHFYFVEIYKKNNKEIEDKNRINKMFKEI